MDLHVTLELNRELLGQKKRYALMLSRETNQHCLWNIDAVKKNGMSLVFRKNLVDEMIIINTN